MNPFHGLLLGMGLIVLTFVAWAVIESRRSFRIQHWNFLIVQRIDARNARMTAKILPPLPDETVEER